MFAVSYGGQALNFFFFFNSRLRNCIVSFIWNVSGHSRFSFNNILQWRCETNHRDDDRPSLKISAQLCEWLTGLICHSCLQLFIISHCLWDVLMLRCQKELYLKYGLQTHIFHMNWITEWGTVLKITVTLSTAWCCESQLLISILVWSIMSVWELRFLLYSFSIN